MTGARSGRPEHGGDAAASASAGPMRKRVEALRARALGLKPVRVYLNYGENRGRLLAGGLSFQSIFAVFAAVWIGFAVAGIVLRSNPGLADAVFSLIDRSIPGLIDTGDGRGAINEHSLLTTTILGWTGAIAAGGLLFTALGWLASARDAVRALFDRPGERTNFLLLKLKDLVLAVCFGAAVLVSAALSVLSTQALNAALGWLGIGEHSIVTTILGRGLGLLLMLLLDTAVLAALFRLLSGLAIPLPRLLTGALLGAIALGVLKVLGTALLGGASRNPLLASFAVIVGLLIWFNLICQVILLAASWIAVGMRDDGLAADPELAAEDSTARGEAHGGHDDEEHDDEEHRRGSSQARARTHGGRR
jgi:membrane protein